MTTTRTPLTDPPAGRPQPITDIRPGMWVRTPFGWNGPIAAIRTNRLIGGYIDGMASWIVTVTDVLEAHAPDGPVPLIGPDGQPGWWPNDGDQAYDTDGAVWTCHLDYERRSWTRILNGRPLRWNESSGADTWNTPAGALLIAHTVDGVAVNRSLDRVAV